MPMSVKVIIFLLQPASTLHPNTPQQAMAGSLLLHLHQDRVQLQSEPAHIHVEAVSEAIQLGVCS